ncbi:MAG: cytochrome-c peroxidase, partial [Candidatus Thiodiazotropha sp.]
PSLRLAAINPPYFHDGSQTTLQGAIRIMGRYQLGRDLPESDIDDIAAFLHTLVGEHIRLKP